MKKGERQNEEAKLKMSEARTGKCVGETHPKHKPKVKRVCETCGKSFEIIPARAKDGRGKYCSIDCRRKADKETRTKLICEVCGKEFFINNWRYGKNRTSKNPRFCSRKCFATKTTRTCKNCGKEFKVKRYRENDAECCSMTCKNQFWAKTHQKELHPQWKGGLSFEPYCTKFDKKFRERVRERFNRKCVLCGKTEIDNGQKLSVHHVEYDKYVCCNGNPPLFVALCRDHHLKTNHNREYWAQLFNEIIYIQYGGKCYYSREEYQTLLHGST